VDLAGSERLDKSSNSKQLQKETKNINLSLTYLEQVILSLSDKSRKQAYIPYRNSLLTTVLKDSLGGNCKTSMMTCLSLDNNSFEETLSSCRFSKRCAQLENNLSRNEHVDKDTLIKKLLAENLKLKK
jgi:kinesin family protein 6/9